MQPATGLHTQHQNAGFGGCRKCRSIFRLRRIGGFCGKGGFVESRPQAARFVTVFMRPSLAAPELGRALGCSRGAVYLSAFNWAMRMAMGCESALVLPEANLRFDGRSGTIATSHSLQNQRFCSARTAPTGRALCALPSVRARFHEVLTVCLVTNNFSHRNRT